MGLDNGVIVSFSNDTYINIPPVIFHNAESCYIHSTSGKVCFEMIYWRKWWGVRNEVYATLTAKYPEKDYHFDLDSEDCEMIADVLQSFKNSDRWDSEGRSIWDYEENQIEDQINVDIFVMRSIAKFLRTSEANDLLNSEKMKVYFYDSY